MKDLTITVIIVALVVAAIVRTGVLSPDPLPEFPVEEANRVMATAAAADRDAEAMAERTSAGRLILAELVAHQGHTAVAAAAAVDRLELDWFRRAEVTAAEYVAFTAFSCDDLIAQLAWEGFTAEEATTGAASTGVCR